MKIVSKYVSVALNSITILIPIIYSINIIFSFSDDEIKKDESNFSTTINILMVIILSLIYNSMKILKLGTL